VLNGIAQVTSRSLFVFNGVAKLHHFTYLFLKFLKLTVKERAM
jgi:hypothetical protein